MLPNHPPRGGTKHGLSLAERFWMKVDTSGECWVWVASTSPGGYGRMAANEPGKPKRIVQAHRLSWELEHGPIPSGYSILHKCDNPRCVRPEHLRLGTHADNMRDCAAKDRINRRAPQGEASGLSVLTAEQVCDIYQRRQAGELLRVLATEYGVSISQVHRIATGKSWRHLTHATA